MIQNKKENVEFMLSAVIYTNEDEILNDGRYEYNTIALPFLAGKPLWFSTLRKLKKNNAANTHIAKSNEAMTH